MSYWNEFGLLRANTYENDQNGLLRVAYYHLFGGVLDISKVEGALSLMDGGNGKWAQHPENTWQGDRASHDEITGIAYFLTLLPNIYWKYQLERISLGYYAKYIQIIFYLVALKYKSKVSLWVACWIIYFGVAKKEKAKNGRWDTDSELLALLKITTIERLFGEMPLKDKILRKIKDNWGDDYKRQLVTEMLHYAPDHPLRIRVS